MGYKDGLAGLTRHLKRARGKRDKEVSVFWKSISENSGKGMILLHSKKVKESLSSSQLFFGMHFRT